MTKPKIVLFDIDYTLFDTSVFKRTVNKKIKDKVINNKLKNLDKKIDNIFLKSREQNGYFNPRHFISMINSELELNLPLSFFEKSLSDDSLYENLYNDVKAVLEELSKDKSLFIGVFSGGDIKFQKSKIELIRHLFHKDHIHIFLNKEPEVKKIINKYKSHKLFIIDDWLNILEKSKKMNKSVITIWIKRKGSEFKEKKKSNFSPDYVLSDLQKITSIIKNN